MKAQAIPRNTILEGDAATTLTSLPSRSVDCIVTSPPYFRLRDYGVAGQLGLESRIEDWADELRDVARECARVLTPTGTLWLNLGDSYSTHAREGAARKSFLLAPERLALALSADGWILRNKIVWAKTNTTPSSVRDRLSTTHEVIYLFARSPRYFFDLDAIRLPHTSPQPRRRGVAEAAETAQPRPGWLGPNADGDRGLKALHASGRVGHPLGKNPGDVWSMSVSRYRGAHFATYPEHLVERMVRAGCPEERCSTCRAPWVRSLRRLGAVAIRQALSPTCDCRGTPEPGLVLDPFLGSGTTAVVAERLRRDWLGIELKPDYIDLAERRIATAKEQSTTKRKEVA